jgi:RHS repeat-associated protein
MKRWFVNMGWVGVMAWQAASAEVLYFHSDHLGSTAVATNSASTVQQIECYTPFGESFTPHPNPLPKGERAKGEGATAYLFTGQELDREANLSYYGARYYDPVTSHFVSVDPVLDGLKPYAYVHSNPIRYNDPSGRQAEPVSMPFYGDSQELYNAFYRGKQTDGPFRFRFEDGRERIYALENYRLIVGSDEVVFYMEASEVIPEGDTREARRLVIARNRKIPDRAKIRKEHIADEIARTRDKFIELEPPGRKVVTLVFSWEGSEGEKRAFIDFETFTPILRQGESIWDAVKRLEGADENDLLRVEYGVSVDGNPEKEYVPLRIVDTSFLGIKADELRAEDLFPSGVLLKADGLLDE